MCQLKVLDQIDSVDIPGAPTNGDIYIINDGADANKIYARDNGAWVEYAPWAGVIAWNVAAAKFIRFDGTSWGDLAGGAGATALTVNAQTDNYTLTISDMVATYMAMTKATAIQLTIPPHSSVAAVNGSAVTGAQGGAGQLEIVAGVGVTLLLPPGRTAKLSGQNASFSLVQSAEDVWRLSGDLEASP
jgi:hypothetical protein